MFNTTGKVIQHLRRAPVTLRGAVLLKKANGCPALACRVLSTGSDRAVGGVMNKEFPGFFDKDHHKHHNPSQDVLDVHDHRKDYEDAEAAKEIGKGRLTCDKVIKALETHPAVHDCAVIDMNVNEYGMIPVAFVVKKPGSERHIKNEQLHHELIQSLRSTLGTEHEALEKDLLSKLDDILEDDKIKQDLIQDELLTYVREILGPFAVLKVIIVEDLPRTVTGKILVGTLYKMARGEPYTITPLIENREVLTHLEKEIKQLLGNQDNGKGRN